MSSLAEAGIEGQSSIPLLSSLSKLQHVAGRRYQKFVDQSTPYVLPRWSFTLTLLLFYLLRVYVVEGFYIVTYGLGIYVLNLLIGFLSPMVDPEDADGTDLPINSLKPDADDWKPFIRKVPEFKFWHLFTRFLIGAFICTFFPFLDIPVFWPILLVYFIALMIAQLKGRIQHMIKHRYWPGSIGKPSYKK